MKKNILIIFTFLCLGITEATAQYTNLLDFNVTNGANPQGSLTLSGTTLYGMTVNGGANNVGCIFSFNTSGNVYSDLLDFNGTNGANPYGSLTISGNTLYGMTYAGGAHNWGCIFSFNTIGNVYTDLLDFNGSGNGYWSAGSLILSGTTLYGMAEFGGVNGDGIIFSLNTVGNVYTDLFNFNGTNGNSPDGSLTLSGNTFYGMTPTGGAHGFGVIFSLNTIGNVYTDLLDFNGTNGELPSPGSLVLSGTTLYGTTVLGGAHNDGCIFSFNTVGNVYTDLLDFNGTNGEKPGGSLILSGTTLFGTTSLGGAHNDGCVYSFNTSGNVYTDLFDFNGTNGESPLGSLTFSGNTLYGMTSQGGSIDSGVIFSLKVPGLGINDLNKTTGSINLHPNPNNGEFTVALQNINEPTQVEIYNMLGEKIYQSILPQNVTRINLTDQSEGIYLYRVIGDEGELIKEGKLVIQK